MYKGVIEIKEQHTLNLRMVKRTERFKFCKLLLITKKLVFIRLSVYNSVFNLNIRSNQLLDDNSSSTVIYAPKLFPAISSGAYDLSETAELK